MNPTRFGTHTTFSKKIASVAEATVIAEPARSAALLPRAELGGQARAPRGRGRAIKMAYSLDLLDYKNDEACELWLEKVEDALEGALTARGKASRAAAPPRSAARGAEGRRSLLAKRKQAFSRFRESDLDPLDRFSVTRESLSRPELALSGCSLWRGAGDERARP